MDFSLQENMPIPSVVIEPASSNEGDDDRDADIISPTAISDNGETAESQTMKHISPSGRHSGLPDGFLYKVRLSLLAKSYAFNAKIQENNGSDSYSGFHLTGGDYA